MRTFTRYQMIDLEERMVQEYGISRDILTENAGRNLTRLVERHYPKANQILIVSGTGGNAAGTLVAARHLHNHGKDVSVLLSGDSHTMLSYAREQAETVFRMGIPISSVGDFGREAIDNAMRHADVIVDGLLGYNIDGSPQGRVRELIGRINQHGTNIVSLDLPSGMHPDEGCQSEEIVKATETLVLGVPKHGILLSGSQEYTGKLYIADISIPRRWYEEEYGEVIFEKAYIKALDLSKL